MIKGRFQSKLLRLAVAALVPTAMLSVALVSPAAIAAPAAPVSKANCRVHAVHASREEGGIQKELAFLADKLKDDEFAAYKSFALVEMKELSLKLNEEASTSFQSGNKLGLTLLGGANNRLELKFGLTKRDGETALLTTKYAIDNGGLLMVRVGDFTHQDRAGKLFFAIQCTGAS